MMYTRVTSICYRTLLSLPTVNIALSPPQVIIAFYRNIWSAIFKSNTGITSIEIGNGVRK